MADGSAPGAAVPSLWRSSRSLSCEAVRGTRRAPEPPRPRSAPLEAGSRRHGHRRAAPELTGQQRPAPTLPAARAEGAAGPRRLPSLPSLLSPLLSRPSGPGTDTGELPEAAGPELAPVRCLCPLAASYCQALCADWPRNTRAAATKPVREPVINATLGIVLSSCCCPWRLAPGLFFLILCTPCCRARCLDWSSTQASLPRVRSCEGDKHVTSTRRITRAPCF